MIGGYRKCSTPSWKICTCFVSPLIAHVYFSITQKRIDTLLIWGKSKVLATMSCLFLIHYCVGATGSCWVCGLVLSSSYCLCRHLHALKFSSNWNKNFTQRSQELCHRDTVESTYEKIDEVDEKQTGQIIRLAKPSTEGSSTVCRLSTTPLSFLLLAGNIVGLMLHCFDHMLSAVWYIWWNMNAVVVTVETDYLPIWKWKSGACIDQTDILNQVWKLLASNVAYWVTWLVQLVMLLPVSAFMIVGKGL